MALVFSGLEGYQATGAALALPYYKSFIAEAQLGLGELNAALKNIDEAFALLESQNDRFCEAELHRLRGVILERQRQDPLPHYQQALHIATAQGSRAYGLRASVSLARYLVACSRQTEADSVLKDATHVFVGDGSSIDLAEARSLIKSWDRTRQE